MVMNEDLTAALDLLPHGSEFRFLDRLLSLEPGKSGAGEYAVRGDEPFLRGHFPGRPMMPGVLLVEAAAQKSSEAQNRARSFALKRACWVEWETWCRHKRRRRSMPGPCYRSS